MSRITATDTEAIENIINDIEIDMRNENNKNIQHERHSLGITSLFKSLLEDGQKKNKYKYVHLLVQSPVDLMIPRTNTNRFVKLPLESVTSIGKSHLVIDNATSTFDLLKSIGGEKHIFEKTTKKTHMQSPYGLTDVFSGN